MLNFFKKDIFTNSKSFGLDIQKWFIYWLGKSGITTSETCCSTESNPSIDDQLDTLHDLIDSLEETIESLTPNYKEYEALISQTGTSDPTVIIGSNTLSGTPVLTRLGIGGTGKYNVTLAGAFPFGKTYYYITATAGDPSPALIGIIHNDADSMRIDTYLDSAGYVHSDDILAETPFRIRVYN